MACQVHNQQGVCVLTLKVSLSRETRSASEIVKGGRNSWPVKVTQITDELLFFPFFFFLFF